MAGAPYVDRDGRTVNPTTREPGIVEATRQYRDVDRAIALAEKLRAGTAWINQHGAFSAALPMPFAGQSGIGMDYAHFGVAEHSRAMLINAKL